MINGQKQSEKTKMVTLAMIKPSPDNDKIYKPIDPNDPEIKALAKSIKLHGLLEPLVITEDYYILSGHRRYVACKKAGKRRVLCRIEPISRRDDIDAFIVKLREHNRQRVKSVAEQAREEAISMDPEESYRRLVEHRQQQSQLENVELIKIVGEKVRYKISEEKQPFAQAILKVIEGLRQYWPVSERQVHYRLLNNPPMRNTRLDIRYQNNRESSSDLSDMVTRMRIFGDIPMNVISDETRPVQLWSVFSHPGQFIQKEMDQVLKGYYRNYQQSQPNHIELLVEKNTVLGVTRPIASEYCIPLTSGRGYSSLPPRYAMIQRFQKSGKENLILLIVSDFDPEGEDIAHSYARSLRDDFDIAGNKLKPIKVALNRSHVNQFLLVPDAIAKEDSSRRKGFVEKHGEDIFELEALEPADLQELIRMAIVNVMDMEAFEYEVAQEKDDAIEIDHARKAVQIALQEGLDEM